MNESYRVMRLIVMFDMPVMEKVQQKEYRRFHKFLIKNGFFMLQYSVYSRFCHNESNCSKFIQRITLGKPSYGNVRLLKITDIQFNNMILLVGEESTREIIENKSEIIEID